MFKIKLHSLDFIGMLLSIKQSLHTIGLDIISFDSYVLWRV